MAKDRKWLCDNESCRSLLGFINEDLNQVRIKYKDLYVSVEGGRIQLTCRKCARVNELVDNDFLNYVLAQRKLEEKRKKPGKKVEAQSKK